MQLKEHYKNIFKSQGKWYKSRPNFLLVDFSPSIDNYIQNYENVEKITKTY